MPRGKPLHDALENTPLELNKPVKLRLSVEIQEAIERYCFDYSNRTLVSIKHEHAVIRLLVLGLRLLGYLPQKGITDQKNQKALTNTPIKDKEKKRNMVENVTVTINPMIEEKLELYRSDLSDQTKLNASRPVAFRNSLIEALRYLEYI